MLSPLGVTGYPKGRPMIERPVCAMIGASCAVADEVARGQAWALRPNYLVARGKGAGGLMHRLLLVTAVLLAAAALSPAEAAERAAALRGLAAKYPGDRGLGSDSAVLAFSDYEDSEWKRGWDCSDWDCYHLTDDPSLAFAGAHSLEKTGPMGSEGATLSLDLKEPVEVLHHRVYARFKEGAANTRFFGISGVAAGLPQWKALGSAGVRPTELPYFCATLVTEEDHPRKPMWYPYHIDQKGPWGDNWPIDVEFPADRWFCLEMMVKMNTPGKPDGELRLWLDGRPVYAKADMRWRNDVSVRIGRAFDMVYRSTPFPNTSTYWVDNRVIATQYVGPMAGTAQATDAADPASGSRQMPDQTQESSGITLFVDPGRRSAADREQHMQYGLSATAPWAGGGSVFINFPEHLEYDTQGLSILRHWDGWENGPIPWVISPDAKQASYTVESPHEKGVMVESSAGGDAGRGPSRHQWDSPVDAHHEWQPTRPAGDPSFAVRAVPRPDRLPLLDRQLRTQLHHLGRKAGLAGKPADGRPEGELQGLCRQGFPSARHASRAAGRADRAGHGLGALDR